MQQLFDLLETETFHYFIEGAFAVLIAYLGYRIKQKKAKTDSFSVLIGAQNTTIERLCKELDALRSQNKEYYDSIDYLKQELHAATVLLSQDCDIINHISGFIEYIPTPVWIKGPNYNGEQPSSENIDNSNIYSKMLFINQAYETQWHISKKSYQHKYDNHLWPKDIADKFAVHDKIITEKQIQLITIEQVPNIPFEPVSQSNPLLNWIIWKFPVIVNNSLVGIGGIAINIDLMNVLIEEFRIQNENKEVELNGQDN